MGLLRSDHRQAPTFSTGRSALLRCALFVFVSIGACSPAPGTTGGSPSPHPVPSPAGTERSQPSGAPASGSPSGAVEPLLSCGGEYDFSPSLLEGPAAAEADPDPAAAALRGFLAQARDPAIYPRQGWVRVLSRPDRAVFLAPGPRETPWLMVVAVPGTVEWQVDSFGACQLGLALPEDVLAGEWWLDPAFPAPQPDDVTVRAIVRERACASGRSPVGRVLDPIVVYGREEIQVTIPIRRRPGPNDCAGDVNIAYLIELDEPIGDRALLDAGVLPPRDARSRP